MVFKNLDDLFKEVKEKKQRTIVVAVAADREIIEIVKRAREIELGRFILVGNEEEIRRLLIENNVEDSKISIINEHNHKNAAEKAVELVISKKADVIMKGNLHTSIFLKAVLNKEKGLNKDGFISQISVYDKLKDEGVQLLTDCAMAIDPNLEEKKQIIENAIKLAIKLGINHPKVALLSAVEVVNPAIPDTLDAAILSKMADRGQIKNAVVDGPFALDNAISIEASEHKNIKSKVAGKADVLVVPNLQVGNVLHKSLSYFGKKKIAAAIMGADAPIIMTSRTDSIDNKLISIALANYISD